MLHVEPLSKLKLLSHFLLGYFVLTLLVFPSANAAEINVLSNTEENHISTLAAAYAACHGAQPDPSLVFANTFYSFVNDEQAVHVANVYRYDTNKKIIMAKTFSGVSPQLSKQEGQYAQT